MARCFRCGAVIQDKASYCAGCIAQLRPVEVAAPVKKVTGGVRGRAIVSIVLGGVSLYFIFAAWCILSYIRVFSLADQDWRSVIAALLMYIYCFSVSLMPCGFNIPGIIQGNKALKLVGDYRPAKVGKILNLISILLSVTAIVICIIINFVKLL